MHALAFAEYELDPARQVLRRAGAPVKIGQRALALLAALVEAGGATVSKPVLMQRAWPGLFVEEANLTVQISALRRLLGPGPAGGEWIITVPGLGYRFAAPLPAVPSRREKPSLVVLPFDHEGDDADAGYFADGVVSDLIAALSRFRSFDVISRSIAATYRGRAVDSREVARELGVRYVLEGSLRRQGERLRTTAQMVDGATGAILWAERFDGSLNDIFALQDRIVDSVAMRVEPSVQISEMARFHRDRTAKATTYDIYLRALADINDESAEANVRAFALLQQALESEPDNANLLSLMAWTLEHRHTMGWPPLTEDDVGLCSQVAHRALQRAQGDAEIMGRCGIALLQAGRDYDSGVAVLRAAAAANPNSLPILAMAGAGTLHCGEVEEAEAHFRRMLDLAPLDPDNRFSLTGLAMIEIIRGDYRQALALAGHSLAINMHFDPTHWMLVAAHAHLGHIDQARQRLAIWRAMAPSVTLARIRRGQPAMKPERIGPVLEGLRLAGLAE